MSDSNAHGRSSPCLSVIVVNWNGARFLPRCLQSLGAQSRPDIQVILVDNGSTDNSVALARETYPEVDILELDENLGYAEANNRAAALSHARYLFFLNNDTHLDSEALSALIAAAEANPPAAILAPQVWAYDGSGRINMGVGLDILGFPCGRRVFYADGAALFIRRDVFMALGGFDASHFMFFEESDLCWRAWLHGYRVGIAPRAIVYHKAGGTAGSSLADGRRYTTSRNKRRLSHRNHLAMLLKNYSTPMLCIVLPIFAVLTMAEILILVISGQQAAVADAYVPAWQDVFRNRTHIRQMRRQVQATRVVSDWVIVRRMQWRLAMVDQFFRTGVPVVK